MRPSNSTLARLASGTGAAEVDDDAGVVPVSLGGRLPPLAPLGASASGSYMTLTVRFLGVRTGTCLAGISDLVVVHSCVQDADGQDILRFLK